MGSIHRTRLVAAALLTLAVAGLGAVETTRWIGRPFAGFLVLENRVVASAGLARWPATAGGEIYQQEIVAVDGVPLEDAVQLHTTVRSLPVGTPLRYTLRAGDAQHERTIETRRFEPVDFALLFGVYLFGGLAMCGVGLALAFLRRGDALAEGTAVPLWIIGMWALSATDLYGPYRLFAAHAALECFLFAGTVHLACVFPYPNRLAKHHPRILPSIYAGAAALAFASWLSLSDPASYTTVHRTAVLLFALSLLSLLGSQILAWINPPNFEARQRVKVLVAGIVLSCAPGLALALGSALTGGQIPENAMGWSGILLPFAIGHAVLRTDLFGVDDILRRSFNYLLTSSAITVVFAASLTLVDRLISGGETGGHGSTLIATSALAFFALLPLRDRFQSATDRVFFRNAYDVRRLLETTSERLASVADLHVIVAELELAVKTAVHPEWWAIDVFRKDARETPQRFGSPPTDRPPTHDCADEGAGDTAGLREEANGGLSIELRAEGRLVAHMFVGRRLSGRFYGASDRRFLKTIANQGAVAIENALALESVRELNRNLEQKVEERTADLRYALKELNETQDQLVHQEKLASLGRLVAGIAHEINNPVNFIGGNLACLRDHSEALCATLRGYEALLNEQAPELGARAAALRDEHDVDYVLGDLESTFAACREGVERTTTIVSDLRTFSRSDAKERHPVDLADSLDSTLSLLRGSLKNVTVVRDLQPVPPVSAVEGQIKQVMMNLIANAIDAMDGHGTLQLRLCPLGSDRVLFEVEDDGCGMDSDTLERAFDPFFTTKDVGKGTGLGLAISYGVIAEHGGVIRAASYPGQGTCFTIDLPLGAPNTAAAAAAPEAGDG